MRIFTKNKRFSNNIHGFSVFISDFRPLAPSLTRILARLFSAVFCGSLRRQNRAVFAVSCLQKTAVFRGSFGVRCRGSAPPRQKYSRFFTVFIRPGPGLFSTVYRQFNFSKPCKNLAFFRAVSVLKNKKTYRKPIGLFLFSRH